ncbi:hypothetical protein ABIA41_003796 [Bradyrhizobium sp. USDA 313]
MTEESDSAVASFPQYSLISLDLDRAEEALELGKKLADRSGRTVIVRDSSGVTLGIFKAATPN